MRNLSHTFGRFFVYNLFFIFTLSNCTPAEEFDVLLTNFELHSPTAIPGKLGERPQFSIGIKDGKIASIIDHSGGQEYPVAKSTLSLNGQHLYPGFIDAHGHLFGYARTLSTVNLIGAASKQECIERIKTYIRLHPNEEWIIGRGWDQNDWTEQRYPSANDLAAFSEKYVYLTRIDGHAAWVNQPVLDAFSITNETKVDGGQIMDGILIDNAETLVTLPKLTNRYWRTALLQAQDSLVKYGLTAMTDAGLSTHQILLLDSLQEEGSFKLFVNAMISNHEEDLQYFENHGPIEKPLLRVKSVKAYLDGALGSRGSKQQDRLVADAALRHTHRVAEELQWQEVGVKLYGRQTIPCKWPPVAGVPCAHQHDSVCAKAAVVDEYFEQLQNLHRRIFTCPCCLQRTVHHGTPESGVHHNSGEPALCRNCYQYPQG